MTDKEILKWYMKGFKDELKGTTSVISENKILNKAYSLGANHAFNDVKSINYLSDKELLKLIKI